MSMRENPKALLFLIVLGVAGSGFLGWELWQGSKWNLSGFARRQLTASSGTLLERSGEISGKEDTVVVKSVPVPISDHKANSLTVGSRNGSVMFYRRANGFVDEVYAPDKSARAVSETPLYGFIRAIWSPDKQSVIGVYNGTSGVEFRYFSYLTKKSVTLPANTKSVAFSPSGDQIVYFATTGDLGGIYLSFPDGLSAKKIFETRIPDLELFWPADSDIYFLTKNQSVGTWDLLLIEGESELKTILKDQKGLELVWSRDGKKLLYSSYPSDLGLELKIYDHSNSINISVPVHARASHCVWSIDGKSFYCGVQEKRPTYQDYFAGILGRESIVKVSASDRKSETIVDAADGEKDLSIFGAVMSPLEDYLFFINYFDGLVYSLEL